MTKQCFVKTFDLNNRPLRMGKRRMIGAFVVMIFHMRPHRRGVCLLESRYFGYSARFFGYSTQIGIPKLFA